MTSLPLRMKPIRSAMSLARKMSWVDMNTDLPVSRIWTRISRNSRPDCGSRPEVGSSRSTLGASLTTAMAMPSFWRMPLEKFLIRRSNASFWRPTRPSTSA